MKCKSQNSRVTGLLHGGDQLASPEFLPLTPHYSVPLGWHQVLLQLCAAASYKSPALQHHPSWKYTSPLPHSPFQSSAPLGEVGSHTALSSGTGRRDSSCLHRRGSGELPSAREGTSHQPQSTSKGFQKPEGLLVGLHCT